MLKLAVITAPTLAAYEFSQAGWVGTIIVTGAVVGAVAVIWKQAVGPTAKLIRKLAERLDDLERVPTLDLAVDEQGQRLTKVEGSVESLGNLATEMSYVRGRLTALDGMERDIADIKNTLAKRDVA